MLTPINRYRSLDAHSLAKTRSTLARTSAARTAMLDHLQRTPDRETASQPDLAVRRAAIPDEITSIGRRR